ncbi:MAG: hydroxymethylglutaryl-CoA reductase, degradative [Anaerolineales bacterium]|nr:hydroxymethylglutaryl-CoA reductase, degradative [Anaerolineales bacterium]
MENDGKSSRIRGFYDLPLKKRHQLLIERGFLSPQELENLCSEGNLPLEIAENMIENVIGTFSFPLGIGLNFRVNGRDVLVPMVVEEPSVVAGASFMAKLAREGGGFTAHADDPVMIGQLQVLDVKDLLAAEESILNQKEQLLGTLVDVDPVLRDLGGGPKGLETRQIPHSAIGPFLVIHLLFDVRDAMGANAVNTACEKLAPHLEEITGGRVHLRILSNLADRRLASAACTIPLESLAFGEYTGEQVRDGIIEAWAFADADPYRAATHNKGIMNGVDAVLLATANDWRAVEAGAHAYAARYGFYRSLSTWSRDQAGNLKGKLELPLAVGLVGGATRVHPGAKAALKLMGVESAQELTEIIVSVGLAQNLAALRALATDGIQKGHMRLHARQVAIAAGAEGEQINQLADQLILDKQVRIDHAKEILNSWK